LFVCESLPKLKQESSIHDFSRGMHLTLHPLNQLVTTLHMM